jgi:hypothetical protein
MAIFDKGDFVNYIHDEDRDYEDVLKYIHKCEKKISSLHYNIQVFSLKHISYLKSKIKIKLKNIFIFFYR